MSDLQNMLQAAVQSVQWTYSLFWQLCPQQRILVWGDGYYNGPIKTRKTVQPMEDSAEEASLQRSQQLRELYDSLSAGDTNPPARRPSAALSPEDLTESEWFYLMCVSFTFPSGVGLPGKAYGRKQHVWLVGANEADSKTFARAILAKCSHTDGGVHKCIPLLDGVVELGTTEKVEEDLQFIQQVKSFFIKGHRQHPSPPKPALSGHSTSNPIPPAPTPPLHPNQHHLDKSYDDDNNNDEEVEEEEEEKEEDGDSESEVEAEIVQNNHPTSTANDSGMGGEPSELMHVEMSEDIRVGSPDDASNNLDSDFHLLASARRWDAASLQPSPSVEATPAGEDNDTGEDTHYSQTVSMVLHNQTRSWLATTSAAYTTYSTHSAFSKWNSRAHHHLRLALEATSQWVLKYVLFTVPLLHANNSPSASDDVVAAKLRGKGTPQDELSANHVLAERRRREKLNERFIILRSLVPFVTKMDKASILGDTIEYVKQLRKKIQDLELNQRSRSLELQRAEQEQTRSGGSTVVDRSRDGSEKKTKKMRVGEGATKTKNVKVATSVQVSIIESDALLELECEYREGLLLDVMEKLREKRIEVRGVQSSVNGGVFVAELRAKVTENQKGKRACIVEVKKALNQIIPHSDY